MNQKKHFMLRKEAKKDNPLCILQLPVEKYVPGELHSTTSGGKICPWWAWKWCTESAFSRASHNRPVCWIGNRKPLFSPLWSNSKANRKWFHGVEAPRKRPEWTMIQPWCFATSKIRELCYTQSGNPREMGFCSSSSWSRSRCSSLFGDAPLRRVGHLDRPEKQK